MSATRAMIWSALRALASASRVATSPPRAFRDSLHLRALRRDPVDGRGARAVHDHSDLLRGGAERGGDALADVGNAFAEALGDVLEIGGDLLVRVVHGGAQATAVGDDRLALIGHLGDQRANAAFVVGIGAFERRDLGTHERLQFGGASQRPLDAVAHRGDFPADRLGQRDDLLARDRFRLREPQRNLRDRARRDAQLLQPARQSGETEQENCRSERGQGEQYRLRLDNVPARRREVRSARGVAQYRVGHAQRQPEGGGDGGRHERRLVRTAQLQGLNDRADRRPIVIGRRRPRAESRFDILGLRRQRRRQATSERRLASFLRRGRFQRRGESGRGGRQGFGGGGLSIGRGGSGLRSFGVIIADRQVQSVFDSRHRRGNRVMSRLFLRHCVRLVRSVAIAHGPSRCAPYTPAACGLASRRAGTLTNPSLQAAKRD